MTLKTKIIISIVVILGAFAAGRYSVKNEITKTHETVTKTDTEVQKDIQVITKKVIIERPDGTKETTISKEINDKSQSDTKTTTAAKDSTKVVPPPSVNVAAMVGYDVQSFKPVYGIEASKQMLGPMTVGLFGLSSGQIGVTIGFTF